MESKEKSQPSSLNDGWTQKKLVDCTIDGNISYGIVQPGSNCDSGVPIVRVNNFTNNGLDLSTVIKVHPNIEQKHKKTRLLGGEVLLTLVGSTGQSTIAPDSLSGWNVARAVAVIRPHKDVGAKWINICLQSFETHHFLDSRANTTVQKTLNLKDVKLIPISIPPKKTKEFIENVVSNLDDKIELNRQTNKTLEAMAQALFKSWFVDFDPIIDKALVAGNPIPEVFAERAKLRAAAKNLDSQSDSEAAINGASNYQHLFPAEFEFSEEMGWVPRDWKGLSFATLAKLDTTSVKPNLNPETTWEHYSIPSYDKKNHLPLSLVMKLKATNIGYTLVQY